MTEFNKLTRGVCMAALLALTATPALAEGKGDRAKKAIAEAQGKVESAGHATSGDAPRLNAEASAALRQAREDFDAGHKESAIAAANHASMLADQAIGIANQNRQADAAAQAAETADANAAAVAAAQQAANAQANADAANARAANAEQSAAAANAQAEALRAAPPVVATTTVTTTDKSVRAPARSASTTKTTRVVKPVTRAPVRASTEEKTTTTTVQTSPAG